ncbi:MAG: hypothetical protein B6240_03525 [Desulfobacteraceae bacterium 4572_87]|nr:MAG: hypothetical protein B6240_03525 [Desulfobacteraceae bacterium 4572_87]
MSLLRHVIKSVPLYGGSLLFHKNGSKWRNRKMIKKVAVTSLLIAFVFGGLALPSQKKRFCGIERFAGGTFYPGKRYASQKA